MKRQDTVAACHINQGVLVVATRIICLAMPYERIAGYGSRIAISLIQHIQRQLDDTIAQNTDARNGIGVCTCYGVRCTSKEVRLTLLDSSRVCHRGIYRLRNSCNAERQDGNTILARQMKRIFVLTGCGQLLATEQVRLTRFDSSLVTNLHLRRSSGLHFQRQDSDTILARQMKRVLVLSGCGQLLATEQVRLTRFDGSLITNLHLRRSSGLHFQRQDSDTILAR